MSLKVFKGLKVFKVLKELKRAPFNRGALFSLLKRKFSR